MVPVSLHPPPFYPGRGSFSDLWPGKVDVDLTQVPGHRGVRDRSMRSSSCWARVGRGSVAELVRGRGGALEHDGSSGQNGSEEAGHSDGSVVLAIGNDRNGHKRKVWSGKTWGVCSIKSECG